MRTESTKHFDTGFVLTEGELRRIIQIVEEQLEKLSQNAKAKTSFSIKYRNGVLATTLPLDEVLSQENLGSSQIVELKFKSTLEGHNNSNSISMQFVNLDYASAKQDGPVSFTINGESRDWTFVTSSLLEERTHKIRRSVLKRYLGGNGEWLPLMYITALFIGLFLSSIVNYDSRPSSVWDTPYESSNPSKSLSEDFEAEIRAKDVKDPVEALILRDKIQERRSNEEVANRKKALKEAQQEWDKKYSSSVWGRLPSMLKFILVTLFPPIALYISRAFLITYYPAYNFSWGDYIEVFRKKESVRKFVLVVVIVGTIVSFIGGILANLTNIGR